MASFSIFLSCSETARVSQCAPINNRYFASWLNWTTLSGSFAISPKLSFGLLPWISFWIRIFGIFVSWINFFLLLSRSVIMAWNLFAFKSSSSIFLEIKLNPKKDFNYSKDFVKFSLQKHATLIL